MTHADLNLSDFGLRLSGPSGINDLMQDLGRALAEAGPDTVMMGGGNPAHIPEVEAVWARRLHEIGDSANEVGRVLGDYDTPRGRMQFLQELADHLNGTFGWSITAENLGITSGSQTGAFLLFNMLAGPGPDGFRRICFPLCPEYIGYADQLLDDKAITAREGLRELHGDHRFAYRLDREALGDDDDIAMCCVSRPTNPTANVLPDEDLAFLSQHCSDRGRLLMVDNAYGQPFPGIIHVDCTLPAFESHHVHSFSLSKLGLPTARNGVVCARPEIIQALAAANAIISLASGSIGQAIVTPLLADGTIAELCTRTIKPFYAERRRLALEALEAHFQGLPYRVHEADGAFFLWLWIDHPQMDDLEVYETLKQQGVIVVPGRYFFYGGLQDHQHHRQCLRLSYCQDPVIVERGMERVASCLRARLA